MPITDAEAFRATRGGDQVATAELARRAARRTERAAQRTADAASPWHVRGAPVGTAPHGVTYDSLGAACDALSALARTWPVASAEGIRAGSILVVAGGWPLTTSPRPEPAPERTVAPPRKPARKPKSTVEHGPPGLVAMFAAPKADRKGGGR